MIIEDAYGDAPPPPDFFGKLFEGGTINIWHFLALEVQKEKKAKFIQHRSKIEQKAFKMNSWSHVGRIWRRNAFQEAQK